MGGFITQIVGTRYQRRYSTLTPIMTSYSLLDASNTAVAKNKEVGGTLTKLTKTKERKHVT